MSGQGENMLIAGIDQDTAMLVETYNDMSPAERAELAKWIKEGERGYLRAAPDHIQQQVSVMAALGFMIVGLQWSQVYNNDGD